MNAKEPLPYAPPTSLLRYTVSGIHPTLGSIEFGVGTLEKCQ
jgi:hypothetical protein